MSGFKRVLALMPLVAIGAVSLAIWKEAGSAFTLYRSSALDANMRIHVATFDTHDGEPYNRENCDIAAGLFAGQPGVHVKYWCEKGEFKK